MSKTRSDAWSYHNDLTLAQTVIKHITDGSTQLRAFQEVGETLGRTAGACGFRWNSNVRKKYAREIRMAKVHRQDRKNVRKTQNDIGFKKQNQELDIKIMILSVKNLKKVYDKTQSQIKQLMINLEKIDKTISSLKVEREKLISLTNKKEDSPITPNEDYQALLSIVQHANRLMNSNSKTNFKQEKIG
ncbi:RsfA family transcriptional regulator [Paenibacillus sp. ISL-20]|uniref:RsfA family transcriptional regulator n=1 Tax=Paenibacillus sp. ISL-20 TaxID=2819163 RepID=UPI001BEB4C4B|nr:RsfA family transcriptional regulator [Paenibacillus sp. ISL-20]MBT2760340.1 RsfA family transcriptional regulator [Paenibacillus sp. ISL-20]